MATPNKNRKNTTHSTNHGKSLKSRVYLFRAYYNRVFIGVYFIKLGMDQNLSPFWSCLRYIIPEFSCPDIPAHNFDVIIAYKAKESSSNKFKRKDWGLIKP